MSTAVAPSQTDRFQQFEKRMDALARSGRLVPAPRPPSRNNVHAMLGAGNALRGPFLPASLADSADNAAGGIIAVPTQGGNPALRFVDAPAANRKGPAVARGLRELQQLQKQTIAVLDTIKGNLEDIGHVLRSPEATRGMEKQRNAAALLARGFATEAAGQADEAVRLLPANPDAYLLLSLSLAANQDFDGALDSARKGLALFDPAAHPFAIQAGLLHALATLGQGVYAAALWQDVIAALPLPILLENLGRVAACYPGDAPEGQLDRRVARRMNARRAPDGVGDSSQMLRALDSATEHGLWRVQRVVLIHIASQARHLADASSVVRFVAEYCVPLSERGLLRSGNAVAAQALKRLLSVDCDPAAAHRVLMKLQLARCGKSARELQLVLKNWRREAARKAARAAIVVAAGSLLALGIVATATTLAGAGGATLELIAAGLVLTSAVLFTGNLFWLREKALLCRDAALRFADVRFLLSRQLTESLE